METFLARHARRQDLNDMQYDLVIGTLLGDGYLVKTTRGYALRINHGPSQKEYVDWKYSMLKDFVNSPPKFAENCYYFRTVSHVFFNILREQFYSGTKKIVPRKLMEERLNPFILAVWIMDDGSKDSGQLRINTQSFSKRENMFLQKLLQAKLGIETALNQDKERYRLRINAKSMEVITQSVRPFVIPSMLYKLPL